MKKWLAVIAAGLAIFLTACGQKSAPKSGELKEVTLVLDYVPNTNHTGIYVAQVKDYYKKAGLKVKIIEPGENTTSAALVAAGKADFGISYQEDVTYAHSQSTPLPIKAIATLVQHNTSSLVARADSGIKSPKDFEGRVYAGWQAPSESAVLQAVMKKAGADFSKLKIVANDGAGPESLGKKNKDIVWYFDGWDGIRAKQAGIKLNTMSLRKLDPRLDYYTPVLITSDKMAKDDSKTVRDFVQATKKGYQYAIKEPVASAKILKQFDKTDDIKFLTASQEYLSKQYTDNPAKWGEMKQSVWDNYTDFMTEYGLIKKKIPADSMYTNEFLEDK